MNIFLSATFKFIIFYELFSKIAKQRISEILKSCKTNILIVKKTLRIIDKLSKFQNMFILGKKNSFFLLKKNKTL